MPSFNFGQYPNLASRFFNSYNFQDPYGYQSNSPMSGRPNPLSATFQQPLPPPIQDQPQTQDQPPPDFMSEYGKLMANRPQRLAYEGAVNEGQPVINRSKWARLGTALTSGAAALGGADVGEAAKLGTDAYWAPQERATRDYQAKVTRLGQAAGFEQSDLQDQLKALEFKQNEYYKGQDLGLKKGQAAREEKLTSAQIDNLHSEMDKRDSDEYIDPLTGIKYVRDKNGVITTIGKAGLSSAEDTAKKIAIAKGEAAAKSPYDLQLERERSASAERMNAASIAGRADVQDKKSAAQIANIKAKSDYIGKGFKPGDTAKQVWNDLSAEFANNPLLKGEDPEDYIDIQAGPGGNSIISAKAPRSYGPVTIPDSDRSAAIKNVVRQAISNSLAKSKSGGTGGGGAIDTRRFLPDPNNPNHTIPNTNYGKPKVG